jgi:hypothetical protein
LNVAAKPLNPESASGQDFAGCETVQPLAYQGVLLDLATGENGAPCYRLI